MAWARLVELAVGFILLMASVSKAARIPAFVGALQTYRLVKASWATSLARAAVAVEGLLGVLLLSQLLSAWALAGAGCLFVAFAVIGWVESLDGARAEPRADCGCLGGVVRLRVGRTTVVMNVAVATACFASAVAFAVTDPATADARLGQVAPASLWPAALSVAALYWLASYGVSVVAVMNDAVEPRSWGDR